MKIKRNHEVQYVLHSFILYVILPSIWYLAIKLTKLLTFNKYEFLWIFVICGMFIFWFIRNFKIFK